MIIRPLDKSSLGQFVPNYPWGRIILGTNYPRNQLSGDELSSGTNYPQGWISRGRIILRDQLSWDELSWDELSGDELSGYELS
jgi:hypothetical protein